MFYIIYKYVLFVISGLSSLNSKNTYLLKSFPSLVHVCRCPGLSVKVVDMDMGGGHWACKHQWAAVLFPELCRSLKKKKTMNKA